VTTDDDLLEWYRTRSRAYSRLIEEFVKAATGVTLVELQLKKGGSAAARESCFTASTTDFNLRLPPVPKKEPDIFIVRSGRTGMLLVMDEFAFWQDREKLMSRGQLTRKL